MTTREALLEAICNDPGDDTVRLAYADHLDELGEYDNEERAQVIRLMIGAPHAREHYHFGSALDWVHYYDKGRFQYDDVAERVYGYGKPKDPVKSVVFGDWDNRLRELVWSRGFIESVRLPMISFLECAVDLCAHPVSSIVITDKNPRGVNNEWISSMWYGSDKYQNEVDVVPVAIFEELEILGEREPGRRGTRCAGAGFWMSYDSGVAAEERAMAALSEACIAYGRKLRRTQKGKS